MILPELFQLPWFCAELSGSAESIRVVDKSTLRENRKIDGPYATHQCDNLETNKPQGPAEILARTNSCLKLRFSKYSTPQIHNGKDEKATQTRNADEGGAFIVLCRVLINKVQTLEREITPEDIKSALALGFDAVYCRSRCRTFNIVVTYSRQHLYILISKIISILGKSMYF